MRVSAVLGLILIWSAGVVSAAEIVDENMILPAKIGNVSFNHEKHKYRVKLNCQACHDKDGQIIGFGKQWAHDVCIGCHMQENYGGPVKCDGCHGNVTG